MRKDATILPLHEVGMNDLELVGSKIASLGEMVRHMASVGISILGGFVITVLAYQVFIAYNMVEAPILERLQEIDSSSVESFRLAGLQIRTMIRGTQFSPELAGQIIETYYKLSGEYHPLSIDVSLRSPAMIDDPSEAGYASQQETYLNIRGRVALFEVVRNCFASLFTDRGISWRHNLVSEHLEPGLAACEQKMVRFNAGVPGVAFSLSFDN